MTRGLDDLLADLAEAVDAATELVNLGKERWDAERPLRLAGEAVIGRLGDIRLMTAAWQGYGELRQMVWPAGDFWSVSAGPIRRTRRSG